MVDIYSTVDGLAGGLGAGSSFSRTIIEVNGNPDGNQPTQFISGLAIDWENGRIYMASGTSTADTVWYELEIA